MSNARSLVSQALSQNNFLVVNKTILRYLEDATAAILLSNLVGLRDYFASINQLVEGQWFFQTIDRMEYDLRLSAKKQSHALTLLEEKGLIEIKKMGRPCTRYFRIRDEAIATILGNPSEDTERIEKDKYYTILNEQLNSDNPWFEIEKKARGNMSTDVFHVMYIMTHALRVVHPISTWTSREVGRLRGFVMNESKNKYFDLPRFMKALTNILHQKRNITTTFDYITEMINQYLNEAPFAPAAIIHTRELTPEDIIRKCKV